MANLSYTHRYTRVCVCVCTYMYIMDELYDLGLRNCMGWIKLKIRINLGSKVIGARGDKVVSCVQEYEYNEEDKTYTHNFFLF